MNIIYLHQYFKFPDENGGTRSYDLAASFISKGFKIVIVTASSEVRSNNKSKWVVIERNGLEVHYIYLPYSNHMSYYQRSYVFLRFLWFSTFRILKLKGDVVLATSTPLTICIPAIIKKWFSKTPFIFEVRDVWPETVIAIGAVKNNLLQNLLYGLEKLVYKNADAIVPLSTDMQKSIISRYPNLREKTNIVIENIAEINRFKNTPTKVNLADIVGFSPRFSVLYAGTFGKANGIHKIIDLAEKTLKLDNKLVYILIGSGSEKQHVLQLAIEKGLLNRNVFILEPVSKSDLPSWYNAVSIGMSFVIDIPELWSNSANKFFDTLAASKPILINYEGWQAEMIRSRNIGFVLSCNFSNSDAKRFVAYSFNSELIEKQKLNAYELAKEKYSLEVATKSYIKVLENIGTLKKTINFN